MNIGISIIYESKDLLVLNKPSGIPSAPLREDESRTAVGFALEYLPSLAEVRGHHMREAGLLHRLDTGTSGLLVFAKTQAEFDRLRAAWKKREVVKHYRAVVVENKWEKEIESRKQNGVDATRTAKAETRATAIPVPHWPKLPHLLDWPMGHSAKSAKRMIAIKEPKQLRAIRGKTLPASTRIIGIKKIDPYLDVTIHLETGVMHQIRCHLAAYGWPLVGDVVYKGPAAERLWLHAWRLNIPTRNSATLSLEAPLPENWPVDLLSLNG